MRPAATLKTARGPQNRVTDHPFCAKRSQAFGRLPAKYPRHFGFGGGPHHCLGHAIARSDMTVALSILPARMRNIRPNGEATYLPDSGNTGPISLPVVF